MNSIEADMKYMIESGQWSLNGKWVFVVFPLIGIVLALAMSRYKGWDFQQFLIASVFSWITVFLVGVFIYHTTITDMIWHIERWVDVFRPVEDNTGG